MKKNKSEIIVITGVTRGLGRAMTEKFIERGCTVMGCGRTQEEIQKLKALYPRPNNFEKVDVSDNAQVAHWASQLLKKGIVPDILINNASVMNQNAPFWNISEEEFSLVIDINVKGMANTVRAFVPAMTARGKGIIVNFSSGWGRSVAAGVAPYCTSKWAVEGLSKSLACELSEGMAAVALNPGVINTEILRKCWPEGASTCQLPKEWAERAVPYILSITSSDNGQSLTVSW